MPDRRIHLYYELVFAEEYGLKLKPEDISFIETIIDHPRMTSRVLEKRIGECEVHPALEAALAGFRIRGILSHDWRSSLGRRVLYRLLECLLGEDSVLIAELHFALDDLWEGRPLEGYNYAVTGFLQGKGLLVES